MKNSKKATPPWVKSLLSTHHSPLAQFLEAVAIANKKNATHGWLSSSRPAFQKAHFQRTTPFSTYLSLTPCATASLETR